jgi:hypothetical protein
MSQSNDKEYLFKWYSKGLKEYLDNTFKDQYYVHQEDFMYAVSAYTEAVTAFIANKPKGK